MQHYQKKLQTALLAEIRNAIEKEKVTQTQIGAALGLKQSGVSTLLSGKSRMSMEQYFVLCELLGRDPASFLQKASLRSQQILPMTPQIESTLYKSELHILLYAAATKEVDISSIAIPDADRPHIRKCLEELVQVGLLKRNEDKYVQKNPNIIYRSFSRLSNSKLHQKIVVRSWAQFDSKVQDKNYLSDKFNYYLVDRFSHSQIREIQTELWKVYEKVQTIQNQNMLNNYSSKETMSLWNIHAMLMTPIAINKE
ncbi:XRE family transcriptional regulator [bacterium]|nr:XRE family transcriptional regulator [bacterium]